MNRTPYIVLFLILQLLSCTEVSNVEQIKCDDSQGEKLENDFHEILDSLSALNPGSEMYFSGGNYLLSDTIFDRINILESYLFPRKILQSELDSLNKFRESLGCIFVQQATFINPINKKNVRIKRFCLPSQAKAHQYLNLEIIIQNSGYRDYLCDKVYCRIYSFQHEKSVYVINGSVPPLDREDQRSDNCKGLIFHLKGILGQKDTTYNKFDYGS